MTLNRLTMRAHIWNIILSLLCIVPGSYAQGFKAKDFSLPSATDSRLIRLSDYGGEVVLINWFRSDCAWSKRETPKLVDLYRKYKDKGFAILGVSDDTSKSVAGLPPYLRQYGVTWPVGYNDQAEFMRDIRPLGRGETPGNYLVSRSGQITYLGLDRAPEDWQRLESAIGAALAEPAVKSSIARRDPGPAPDFDLTDLQGRHVRFKDLLGKPTLFDFFNSQTCDWAEPAVVNVSEKYVARGFQVIGIDLFDDDAAVQSCKSKYKMSFPILHGTNTVQQAWIGSTSAWAAFFITPDGKVFKMIRDSIDDGLEGTVFPKYAEYMLTHH